MKDTTSSNTDFIQSLLQECFQNLDQAAVAHTELHDVERQIFKMIQVIGLHFLVCYLDRIGTGHQAKPPCTNEGRPMVYKGTVKRTRFSVFGPLKINRAAYAKPEGGMYRPLDRQLNLPQGEHSYLLQNRIETGAVETDFHEAAGRLNSIFGFDLQPYVPQKITSEASDEVAAFYDQSVAPSPETEGSHSGFGGDGKGVRILKSEREKGSRQPDTPKARLGRGEKNGLKKEAVVTVDFSFNPQPRQAKDIVNALLKKLSPLERKEINKADNNRRAENWHTRATPAGKSTAMAAGMERLSARDSTCMKPIITLMDGDPSLEKTI